MEEWEELYNKAIEQLTLANHKILDMQMQRSVFRDTIKSVLKLSPLWLPQTEKISCEYGDELLALSKMKKKLEDCLK